MDEEIFVKNIRLVFALMCICVPFSVFAQLPQKLAPETYGTSSLTYVSLSPWDFRPIDSTDGMTAQSVVMEEPLLRAMATRLLDVPGICGVFYDLTHKPPGTIEWE